MKYKWTVELDGSRLQIICFHLLWENSFLLIADGIQIKTDSMIFSICGEIYEESK